MAAASTAITAASAATTTAAFRLRPRFIDHEVSAAEVLPVQRVNRAIRIFVTGDFDECKSARLPSKAVAD
jgi:hypothetical protein